MAISDETMRSEGIEVVLGNLRVPPGPGLRPLSFLNADDKQRMLKLKREHELISVTLLRKAKEELEIAPLHAKQGWRFDVRPEEFLRVKLPLANSEFLKVLDQAFDTAT